MSRAPAIQHEARELRQVIVHYHMFKNAGSTFDSMLQKTFGPRWVNYDKEQAAAYITPEEMAAFIAAHPKLLAVSSHHAVLPLPELPGVDIVPALFFRHPLDRVRSVYDFERRQFQQSGPVSKGAEHAGRLSFTEYLRWRLESTGNGVVNNFQTLRMIFNPKFYRRKITDADFETAWARVHALPFFGLVERFDESMHLISKALHERGTTFGTDYVARNQSQREDSLEARLDRMRAELGEPMWKELVDRNRLDLELYERADREFASRLQVLQQG
jgi:hypothetical protein